MALATVRLKHEALDHYRRVAGIFTNGELSRRMGMDKGTISKVLNGARPGPDFIGSLVQVFDGAVTQDDLFETVRK